MPINPKNQPSVAALIIGVLFLLVGLIFLVGSWGAYLTDTQIQNTAAGASAKAQIIEKVFVFDAEGDSDYSLKYWFTTKSGAKINASHNVSKSFWHAVSDRQIIEVKYSVSNPTRNFPSGEGVTSMGMSIYTSVFGGLFAIFGGALIWGYFRTQHIPHDSSGTG